MPLVDDEVLTRIHEGWDHLRRQRPFAAWASWRRALRLDPENLAAKEALDLLASAHELPLLARAELRFRPPGNDSRRNRWTETFESRDLSNLDDASEAFAELIQADAEDTSALYNLAVCLAWRGENRASIAALEGFVAKESDDTAAIASWTLAEVLRQGAGAEELADDVSHTLEMNWDTAWGDPIAWLSTFARLRELPGPIDPVSGLPAFPDVRAFEWLDRPMPSVSTELTSDDLPRARLSVIFSPGSIRFASPDDQDLWSLQADLETRALPQAPEFDARTTPLPLTLLDAAVWRFRFPEGLDPEARWSLTREAIEHDFEDRWMLRPRRGLSTTIPLDPRQAAWAAETDAVLRRKLAAIVTMREAIAARPRSEPLYAGYPFDRLRRRLGLPLSHPDTVDPADVSCMGEADFRALDLTSLDDLTLMEAERSARFVAKPATLARIEQAIAGRGLSVPEE